MGTRHTIQEDTTVRDPFQRQRDHAPFDTMTAWASGELRTAEAIRLVGADDLFGLIAACASSGVPLHREMTGAEREQVASLNEIVEPLV